MSAKIYNLKENKKKLTIYKLQNFKQFFLNAQLN